MCEYDAHFCADLLGHDDDDDDDTQANHVALMRFALVNISHFVLSVSAQKTKRKNKNDIKHEHIQR